MPAKRSSKTTPPPRPKIDPARKAAAQQRAAEREAKRNAPPAPPMPKLSEIARQKIAGGFESEYFQMTDAEHNEASTDSRSGFLAMRLDAQLEKLRAMEEDERITEWSEGMLTKHGSRMQVRHEITLDGNDAETFDGDPAEVWRLGLALARYGEAPEHWPAAWTNDDVERSGTWLSGVKPAHWVRQAPPLVPDPNDADIEEE